MPIEDIKKSEIKKVKDQKWKFDFRENGFVVLSLMKTTMKKLKKVDTVVVGWEMQLHAVDLESTLNYIYKFNRGKCGYLNYEELESV